MLKVQSSSVDNMWLALGWACVNISFFYGKKLALFTSTYSDLLLI